MKKDGLYLTKQELKELLLSKKKKRKTNRRKKRKYLQDDRTPKTAVQGIRSTSDHVQGFGTQINRSNDLSIELARKAIQKEEQLSKEIKKIEKIDPDSTALTVSTPHSMNHERFRDTEAHQRIGHIVNYLEVAQNQLNSRFDAIEGPNFRTPFPQNNNLSEDLPVVHEEPTIDEPVEDDDDDRISQISEKSQNVQAEHEEPEPVFNNDLNMIDSLRSRSIAGMIFSPKKEEKEKDGSKSSVKSIFDGLLRSRVKKPNPELEENDKQFMKPKTPEPESRSKKTPKIEPEPKIKKAPTIQKIKEDKEGEEEEEEKEDTLNPYMNNKVKAGGRLTKEQAMISHAGKVQLLHTLYKVPLNNIKDAKISELNRLIKVAETGDTEKTIKTSKTLKKYGDI